MRLEDYFVFLSPENIQIRGTTVAIERVLYDFLYRGDSPEAIASRFPTLRIEHVYATITYYWHYQEAVESYVANWMERERLAAEQQAALAEANNQTRSLPAVQAA